MLLPLAMTLLLQDPDPERLLRLGQFGAAESAARDVLARLDRARDAASHARASNVLGVALFAQGRDTEAEAALRAAASGLNGADAMRALSNLALVLSAQGQTARAEPMLRRSLWWFETHMPEDKEQLAREHRNLGALYVQQWRSHEGRRHLRRAAELWARGDSASPEEIANRVVLARADLQDGYLDAAEEGLRFVSGALAASSLPEEHPLRLHAALSTGVLRGKQGRSNEARAIVEAALRVEWNAIARLPNDLLRRSIGVYREILLRDRDRAGLRRVARWLRAMERGHRKDWACGEQKSAAHR
jgi:tetratricopeptide (TPR) repeat protein